MNFASGILAQNNDEFYQLSAGERALIRGMASSPGPAQAMRKHWLEPVSTEVLKGWGSICRRMALYSQEISYANESKRSYTSKLQIEVAVTQPYSFKALVRTLSFISELNETRFECDAMPAQSLQRFQLDPML
jgi:hypothetical protein